MPASRVAIISIGRNTFKNDMQNLMEEKVERIDVLYKQSDWPDAPDERSGRNIGTDKGAVLQVIRITSSCLPAPSLFLYLSFY